jgi:CheY-like chemotaxis protein
MHMPAQAEPAPAIGLLLCDDLMFTSRITGTAQALGLAIRPARSVEAFKDLAGQQTPACVLADLAYPGLVIAELVRWLRAACEPMPRVVAYGSHVDTATLRAAREAGCDLVLPRSKFVEVLPVELAAWMGARESPAG